MAESITEFKGEHRFLSNFGGIIRLTSEHIFQAMKATQWDDLLHVLAAPTPGEAKTRGNKIECRPDWEEIKDEVMWCTLQIKFDRDAELKQKLLATGDAELIEGNRWGDDYWGFDLTKGAGQNKLGKMLMDLRDLYREEQC